MEAKRISDKLWVVKLSPGEDILEGLAVFAREKGVGGFVNGIGAVKEPELGYFDLAEKSYKKKKFDGEFELLSLSGNISFIDNEPLVHVHAVLGRNDFSTIGGHLFSAEVSVTAEIVIIPWDMNELSRTEDQETGLKLWKLCD
ncbi:DNA-binding protein [bacterium]|nr:DNA-binding protein [bacterium]